MRWPRGKYNGQRIVGIRVFFVINLRHWILSASWNFGEPYIFCGPFAIRVHCEYEQVGAG